MWDTICRLEAMKCADAHFSQLQDVFWKDKIEGGARIVKFHNTHASALDILNEIPTSAGIYDDSFRLHVSMISGLLFGELVDRIQGTQIELSSIFDNRIRLLTNPCSDLEVTIVLCLNDARKRHAKFVDQLVEFGTVPPDFDINPQTIAFQALFDITILSQNYIHAINAALSQLTPHTSANRERRSELKELLKAAQTDFNEDYDSLRKIGPPPPGCDPFISSIVPSSAGILLRTEIAIWSIFM
ncbi:hypothetical protein CVT24_010996 [Panaeolus cyanescens]|uniref:Uncharacterized protein n=1 Tax=Panaeolus cyanescens TaxID=181874 RepID=A0A409X125_9AGAR|nr:hypothetical protein CVT24_010996 [Panaeolus cyanescens]